MNKNKEFVFICIMLFVSASIIYGLISLWEPIEPRTTDVLKNGVFGGNCVAAIFCGGYLFAGFIKNKNIVFKVIAVLLFPFTILGIVGTGIAMLIPTIIMKITK